jgi:signal transduction histidine kinase
VEAGLASPGRVRLATPEGVRLLTDPDMLRQVVGNLLRNAVQYGGEDPVMVQAQAAGEQVALTFSNGGVPLGQEERARIFERFYRGRSAYRTEGFGLGLPLVKEICEVLGGRVELVGQGPETVFRVTLPRTPVVAGAQV